MFKQSLRRILLEPADTGTQSDYVVLSQVRMEGWFEKAVSLVKCSEGH